MKKIIDFIKRLLGLKEDKDDSSKKDIESDDEKKVKERLKNLGYM